MNCIRNYLNKEGAVPYIARGLIIGSSIFYANDKVQHFALGRIFNLCASSGNSILSHLACPKYPIAEYIPKIVKQAILVPLLETTTLTQKTILSFLPKVCTFSGNQQTKSQLYTYLAYLNHPTPPGNGNCDRAKKIIKNTVDQLVPNCQPYLCPLEIFTTVAIEEFVFRKLIQKKALLAVAKLMPQRVKTIVEHPITRVTISAALFSLAHFQHLEENTSHASLFMTGLFLGAATEITGELFPSIVAHFIVNFKADTSPLNDQRCQLLYSTAINHIETIKEICNY